MGGLASVLTAAVPLVAGGIDDLVSRRNDRDARQQSQKQLERVQLLQEQQAAADAALEREKMGLEARQVEDDRKAALKRAVARQKAVFGAQGVGSGVGSGQAVLLGLFEESDAERARREQMDALRLRVVDEGLSQRRARNVLERTDLQERNRLAELSDNRALAAKYGGMIF